MNLDVTNKWHQFLVERSWRLENHTKCSIYGGLIWWLLSRTVMVAVAVNILALISSALFMTVYMAYHTEWSMIWPLQQDWTLVYHSFYEGTFMDPEKSMYGTAVLYTIGAIALVFALIGMISIILSIACVAGGIMWLLYRLIMKIPQPDYSRLNIFRKVYDRLCLPIQFTIPRPYADVQITSVVTVNVWDPLDERHYSLTGQVKYLTVNEYSMWMFIEWNGGSSGKAFTFRWKTLGNERTSTIESVRDFSIALDVPEVIE